MSNVSNTNDICKRSLECVLKIFECSAETFIYPLTDSRRGSPPRRQKLNLRLTEFLDHRGTLLACAL